ncbi:hypothetical protein ACIOWF_14830 [Cellulosimicrobium cellulans]|uniref:DUF2076 domain-containing protein n=1 Tax=Cellulosimicrobium cellulans F16 TaxID=1350482 RepID=A0A0M0F7T1_CELCE|nr:hypothetical protein [Cellulosimicrobium cellulans]KON73508.1 hypothetical protein M768_11235 [Cellulosimicrobium cellulans F16]
MGFLDRLLGREPRDPHGAPQAGPYGSPSQHPTQYPPQHPGQPAYGSAPQDARAATAAPRTPDQVAVDRYRYLLRTAPPDQVEQAHAEAFARLTPEQRRQVLTELGEQVPASERAASDAPQDLARMATRAEMRQPGTLERTFAGRGQGAPGFGAMVGSSLLGTIAGVVIGSAVANALFGPAFADPTQPVAEDAAAEQAGAEDPGAAEGGDGGAVEAAGEDPSGGGDDGGGDFGGGDFGGGDFGGGFDDFGGFGEF